MTIPTDPDSNKIAGKVPGIPDNLAPGDVSSTPQFQEKPFTWMGMNFDSKQATQFYQVLVQSIGQEISKDQQNQIEALRQIREDLDQ